MGSVRALSGGGAFLLGHMMTKVVNNNQASGRLDTVKWLVVGILIVGGIYANYHFAATAWAIRAAIGIVLAIVLLFIGFQTQKGKTAWEFLKGARVELRKVVWPTRQEAVQTTMIVIVLVAITALILWGLDAFFLWAISLATGHGG